MLLSGLLCDPLTKTLLDRDAPARQGVRRSGAPDGWLHGGTSFICQVIPGSIVLLLLEPGGAACQLQDPCFNDQCASTFLVLSDFCALAHWKAEKLAEVNAMACT